MPTIRDIPKEQIVKLKDKTVIFYDNGSFVEMAKTLSRSFGKMYYFMPWKNAFPRSNQMIVGTGVEGLERINNFWDYVEEADLIIFPDVYDGDLQLHLEHDMGKLVWGSRKGEELELMRVKMKEYMKSIGLFVTPYEVITGMDNLRKYLKEHEEVYVKQELTRGDFETFYSKNYKLVETVLDEIEYTLGATKLIKEFIVEESFPDSIEIGCDLYTVDGEYPTKTMCAIEVKDLGMIGKVIEYDKISEKLTGFNKKISPALKNAGYRGFMSTEVRIAKGKEPYMVDFCARQATPGSELYQLLYKNLAEIIWYGASGFLIDPVIEKRYGVETMITSTWADKNWMAVYFPEEYRDNIKLKNLAVIEGKYYSVPQYYGGYEIGAVVTEANSLQEAINLNKKIALTIEGHYLSVKTGSIEKAMEEFATLEKMGVKIL